MSRSFRAPWIPAGTGLLHTSRRVPRARASLLPPCGWVLVGLLPILLVGCDPAVPRSTHEPRPTTERIEPLPEPEPEWLVEQFWDVHYLMGARVGHRHTEVFRLDEGRQLRRETDQLRIQRFGDVARQTLVTSEVTGLDGEVLQLEYRLEATGSMRSMLAQPHGNQLWVTRDVEGREQVERIPWTDPRAGFFAVSRSLTADPLEPGEQRRLQMLVPLFDSRPVSVELAAQEFESVALDGQRQDSLLRIEARVELAGGRSDSILYWVDRQGAIQKTVWKDLEQTLLRTTAAEAQRPPETFQLDLARQVGVPVRGLRENPHATETMQYRVELDADDPLAVFPVSDGQALRRLGPRAAQVVVRQVTHQSPLPRGYTPAAPTTGDSQPSELIDSDDAGVQKIARAATLGAGASPLDRARAIERYVHQILEEVDFTQVFAPAAEVAVQRSGDCSEHAVLVAACCRALDMPARIAVGLVYSAEDQAFLYHMWTEVWIEDRWLPLDATLLDGVQGGHLKLAHTNLRQASVYSLMAPVLRLLGKIRIEPFLAEPTGR